MAKYLAHIWKARKVDEREEVKLKLFDLDGSPIDLSELGGGETFDPSDLEAADTALDTRVDALEAAPEAILRAASFTKSGGDQASIDTSPDVITWGTTNYDNGSYISGNTFVIPVGLGGMHTLSLRYRGLVSIGLMTIRKNGTPLAYHTYTHTQYNILSVTEKFAAGDIIDVTAQAISGTTTFEAAAVFTIARIPGT